MWTLFKKFGQGLAWLGQLLISPLTIAREKGILGPIIRWTLHFAMVVAILVLLGFINYWFGLYRYLRAPWGPLRQVWLPILFLLMYVLMWLGWWLRRLFLVEDEDSVFPDIDSAWREARDAMLRAGIDITDTPIFLILGQSMGGGSAFLEAGGQTFIVRGAPTGPQPPLRVHANASAIFVSTEGVSLLARQAALLSGADEAQPGSVRRANTGETAGALSGFLARPDSETPPAFAPPTRRRRLVRDSEEFELLSRRLAFLMRQIVDTRRPYSPINGIILALPLAATGSEDDSRETATILQRELRITREVLGVDCPIHPVLCDLERTPGFSAFLAGLPAEIRRRPLGHSFPLAPELDGTGLARMIESGCSWIGEAFVPEVVYRLLELERPGERTGEGSNENRLSELRARNASLYRFLDEMRMRTRRAGDLLARGVLPAVGSPPRITGLYLAATGADAKTEQAFLSAVIEQAVDQQNAVAWTAEALEENVAYQRATEVILFAFFVFVVVAVIQIVWLWPRSS